MFFASDNGAPCPPQVMAALAAANDGPAMPYGADPLTARAVAMIRDLFEAPGAAVHLVATGTAANALALATLCPAYGAVFCADQAHILHDECGAPEFYTGGAKLLPVAAPDGRMDPAALAAAADRLAGAGVHAVRPAAVSLSNLSELGTLHTPAQVAELAAIAHARGLAVHMDGARLANALATAGCSPAEATWKAGVDVLSLGGTKNGLMGAEAVIVFDPARAADFDRRRKRGGHLLSKHRYLAAQVAAWLEGGLWLDLATRANAMAARLAAGIAALPGGCLLHPVQGNMVFATLPAPALARAQAAGATFYPHGDGDGAVRLVASWATTAAEVDGFLSALRG